jgi:hypothetical protein
MNVSQMYIAVSIIVLAIVAGLWFFVSERKKSREQRLTPLAGLAFGFILAGLFFGAERLIGYGLTGIGVILAVVDIIRRLQAKNHENLG